MFKKNKKVPTILGILLLVIGAGAGVFLVSRETGFLPRAAPELAPQNLTVTNITENSFTISWVTDEKAPGFLRYGESPSIIQTIKRDDRDELTGATGEYQAHHITIRGLEPTTTYYFKVGSGKENQVYDNNGQPYQVTTAGVLGAPPPADTTFGEVLTSASTPADGAIVYVSLPGAARLSTLVKDSGQWALSLSTARTQSLSSYVDYDKETTQMDVLIVASPTQESRVVVTTGNDQPVPTITMGGDYDFSDQKSSADPGSGVEKEALNKSATQSATPSTKSGFNLSPLGDVTEATEELTILNPTYEDEGLNTTQPEFLGTAPAGTTLVIEVHSDNNITDQVIVGEDNVWSWAPSTDLDPGEHTITVSYTDEGGILQTLTRSFVVYAAESSDPAFTATPSATPKPTPIPTAQPRISQPSTQSGLPQSGAVENTIALLSVGGMMMIVGWWLQRKDILTS